MLSKEAGFFYPIGVDIVARSAWINIFGETINGGITQKPQMEFLSPQINNPRIKVSNIIEVAKHLGPPLVVHFIGDRLGWNPAISIAFSVALVEVTYYLRTRSPINFVR